MKPFKDKVYLSSPTMHGEELNFQNVMIDKRGIENVKI